MRVQNIDMLGKFLTPAASAVISSATQTLSTYTSPAISMAAVRWPTTVETTSFAYMRYIDDQTLGRNTIGQIIL